MSQPLIRLRHLSVQFEDAHALDDISFDVHPGDKIAIIGPNGAGKSTLLKALMGLIQPSRGSEIIIQGGAGRLGYVPQHDAVNWDFPVTVYDVVMMGLTRQIGWLRYPGRQHHARVMQALDRVGMADQSRRSVADLSGGQRRRVFIARSLAQDVDVLMLDEPFAGVDVQAQSDLMQVINQLNRAGLVILLTTHDLSLASDQFPLVMALNRRLIGFGNPAAVFQPQVLGQLYGGAVITLAGENSHTVVIDEHGCEGCG